MTTTIADRPKPARGAALTRVLLAAAILSGLASCSSVAPVPAVPPMTTPAAEKPAPEQAPGGVVAAAPEKAPEPPAPPSPERVLADVYEHLAAGRYDAALASFDRLAAADAAEPAVMLVKAAVLTSAGRTGEAKQLVEEVSRQDPNNVEALFVLAAAEAAEGHAKEQKALLERVTALDPGHAQALAALGTIAYRSGIYKLSEAYYDKSLQNDPAGGEALIGKARVRRKNDDPRGAEAALNQAIAAYPDWALPLVERGRVYREAGFLRDALRDLDAAEALDPLDYYIAVDRGGVLLDLGRKEEALKEFDRAIAIDGENFLAYVYSAGIRDERGDYQRAEADYAALARLRPDYYFAFEGLGILKMRDGAWAEARDAFLEAYKQAPNHTNYALLAALNWLRLGNRDTPRVFLEKVLKAVPRESIEWYLLRLYYDQSGDTDLAVRIDREKNADTRARMLYYLAQYYDIRGNKSLADKYFLQVRDLDRQGIVEWRLNEWMLADRVTGS